MIKTEQRSEAIVIGQLCLQLFPMKYLEAEVREKGDPSLV